MNQARASFAVLATFSLVCTLGCVSSSDLASIDSQLKEIQLQVLQLQKQTAGKTEVDTLEAALTEKLQTLLRSAADTRADLDAIETQIEQLGVKMEDTHFRLSQISQQVAATQQELQAMRSAAEEARSRPAAAPTTAIVNPADPQALYDTAYNDYLQGNFDLAILGFRQYAETYRSTDLADNATYWLGECYYRQGKFQQAIEQFDLVLARFDRSDRTASALLKKGYAYFELGQRAQGIVQLQNVVREYQGTDEAKLAKQRLDEMGVTGAGAGN